MQRGIDYLRVKLANKKAIIWVNVDNATFSNISVISWRSVIIVKYPLKNIDLPQVTSKLDQMLYQVDLVIFVIQTHNFSVDKTLVAHIVVTPTTIQS